MRTSRWLSSSGRSALRGFGNAFMLVLIGMGTPIRDGVDEWWLRRGRGNDGNESWGEHALL